jgi:EpsI family protein
MRPGLRFSLAAGLVAATAILLQARGRNEVFPPRTPLKSLPAQLGSWTATDISIDKETLDILGPGEFLLRKYSSEADADPIVNLFIAYFPSQRAGDTIHSPQHCLPGAGWTPVANHRVTLSLPGHDSFPANLYIVSHGDARRLVLYWFWAHDRGVASEYWAKFYLIKDAIKLHRSDGALVRIMIDMNPGETPEAAQKRILPFTARVVPLLDDYIPR